MEPVCELRTKGIPGAGYSGLTTRFRSGNLSTKLKGTLRGSAMVRTRWLGGSVPVPSSIVTET